MKRTCAVLVVSGRTATIKEDLKERGFKYNAARKSWAKFDEVENIESLSKEGKEIAMKYLGNVLIDVFLSNQINEF
jgi:hypothetical protein